MGVMRPLSTLLSQALVAHTIELDNEAEHRLPHRTTRQGDPGTGRAGPWLVSFALWANVLQYLDDEGTTVAELRARARTGQLLLGGLRRWGYVTLTPPAGQPLRNPPQDGSHRATPESRAAGAGGVGRTARRHRRPLARAPGPAGRRAAGAGPAGRVRPPTRRTAGLSPRRPSDPGRQAGGAPSTWRARPSVRGVIFDRLPVTAPQRRAVRLHGRGRVDGTDLPAHQRQHLARARPLGHAGERPAAAHRGVAGGQCHVHRLAGTPRLRRHRTGPDGTPGQGRPAHVEG